jgi:hypothetical protein
LRPLALRSVLIAAFLAPLVLTILARPAEACLFCDGGPTGVNDVRMGIFNDDFWPRAAGLIAPFPVLGAIVALIYFGPPRFVRTRPEA